MNSKWYTSPMSPKRPYGKRVLPVPIKLSAEEKTAYSEIASPEEADRPLGYIIRELALRGLVEFRKDGKLRASTEEIAAALAVVPKSTRSKKVVNS